MKKSFITPGISDDIFIRDKVPMTKEEVRVLSVCKLHLTRDAIVYDVGSGTGSIAVETALMSDQIKVYAIETNPVGVALIQKNSEQFDCQNIEIVEGMAPYAFEGIEAPTHAFIGGSKGNLFEILDALYAKNPTMRLVMNAVSLESLCQMQEAINRYPVENVDIVQISVNKANQLGNYHMLQANNPVFIVSFDFCEDK